MARPRGRLLLSTRGVGGGRGRRGQSAEHMSGATVGRMSLHTYIERHVVGDTGADKAKWRWMRRHYDARSSKQCRRFTRKSPFAGLRGDTTCGIFYDSC